MHASPKILWMMIMWTVLPTRRGFAWVRHELGMLQSSGLGQFFGFYVVDRVLTTRLVQWLKSILHPRKKERKATWKLVSNLPTLESIRQSNTHCDWTILTTHLALVQWSSWVSVIKERKKERSSSPLGDSSFWFFPIEPGEWGPPLKNPKRFLGPVWIIVSSYS